MSSVPCLTYVLLRKLLCWCNIVLYFTVIHREFRVSTKGFVVRLDQVFSSFPVYTRPPLYNKVIAFYIFCVYHMICCPIPMYLYILTIEKSATYMHTHRIHTLLFGYWSPVVTAYMCPVTQKTTYMHTHWRRIYAFSGPYESINPEYIVKKTRALYLHHKHILQHRHTVDASRTQSHWYCHIPGLGHK